MFSEGEYLKVDSEAMDNSDAESQESALIRRIQSGEKDDFRQLVLRYQNLVFSMVMRQVSNAQVAEELSQEIFIKAYLNIKKFRLESKFSTWLTRIALNHTNSYFTSRRYKISARTESFDIQKHEPKAMIDGRDTENDERQENLLNKFKIALSRLKPIFRDVLVLCALEGKSYDQASEVLEIPVGTVRSRLNKARLLMRQVVEEVD